jgi:hypothetical protein
MDTIWIIALAVVILVLLVVVARFLKSCLPKIVVGVIILGALGYLIYWYFTSR